LKILFVSDAWRPQINGVVRTLEATVRELERLGHEALVVGPDETRWLTIALPIYPEIKLEFFAGRRLARLLDAFQPDSLHIATEGPLGFAARKICLQRNLAFTTAYHTRFPEYVAARAPRAFGGVLRASTYALLRRFHAPAAAVLVATASIERELQSQRFHRLARWSRGVDSDLFRPYDEPVAAFADLPRPILLYVGRIAAEKNLPGFLSLATPGAKVVIGDGPELASLRAAYPQVHFLGAMTGETLARHYAAADLFVFPSKTDTFGLVLLEACAAGLRIAAMPAPGPSDIFANGGVSEFAVMDDDLALCVSKALQLPHGVETPRAFALRFSWEACTRQFLHFASAPAPSPQATSRAAVWRSRLARVFAR
jgi:glycosyltransferase involved in cell wall biosynthesis